MTGVAGAGVAGKENVKLSIKLEEGSDRFGSAWGVDARGGPHVPKEACNIATCCTLRVIGCDIGGAGATGGGVGATDGGAGATAEGTQCSLLE